MYTVIIMPYKPVQSFSVLTIWLVITCARNPITVQRSAKITVASSVLLGIARIAHSLDHMIRDEAFGLCPDSVPIMLKKVPIMPVFSQPYSHNLNNWFSIIHITQVFCFSSLPKKRNYGTSTAVCEIYGL